MCLNLKVDFMIFMLWYPGHISENSAGELVAMKGVF